MQAAKSDYQLFMDLEIERQEKELGLACCFLRCSNEPEDEDASENESDDEEEPSLEKLQRIPRVFVPQAFEQLIKEVGAKLDLVGLDSPDDCFKMLCTHHSSQMMSIISAANDNIEKAIRRKQWPEALCRLLELLRACREATGGGHWFIDTEEPERVVQIYKTMLAHWVALRGRSDQELGGVRRADAEQQDWRTAVDAFVRDLAEDMEQGCSIEYLPAVTAYIAA